jgi:hypothetical protein
MGNIIGKNELRNVGPISGSAIRLPSLRMNDNRRCHRDSVADGYTGKLVAGLRVSVGSDVM